MDINVIKEMKGKWKGKVVLVAEDVDTSNMFYKAALSKTGVSVIWTEDGNEALEHCKKQEQVDLILMDINMPGLNGLEATKAIKEIRPEIPIVVQTAYLLSNEREKSFEAGADDFISKPITYQKLLEVLNTYLKED
ncbi:MAG: response regulator [Bacteroidales bacterium]|nr:response regulator [Bacteroidales bacterium]